MSLKLSTVKDIKNIEIFLAENIKEIIYSSEDENPRKYSKNVQMKDLQQTLKSMNDSLLSLLMSYVGSVFQLLSMYWYRSMKPFRNNLKLVMKKCLYS